MKISIIGSAGRRSDSEKVTRQLFDNAKSHCLNELSLFPNYDAVSGGAALADHIIVSLFLDGKIQSLTLYLPCEFNGKQFKDGGFKSCGAIANYYHKKFSDKTGIDSLSEIAKAINIGANSIVIPGGFHARNLFVGASDVLLAYTFFDGLAPSDGGTKHCWDNSKAGVKKHFCLTSI
jgi:hypothetical protein